MGPAGPARIASRRESEVPVGRQLLAGEVEVQALYGYDLAPCPAGVGARGGV